MKRLFSVFPVKLFVEKERSSPREIHDSDSEAYLTGAGPAKSESHLTGAV